MEQGGSSARDRASRGARSGTSRLGRIGLLVAIAVGMLPALAGTARAATTVTVSLTFDDTFGSQYTLAYQHALQQHATHATFLVNSGVVGTNANKLSWAQLQDLAAHGNEIGG